MASVSVLLVDDDDPFRTTLSRLLKSADYSVAEAADGVQALQRLSQAPADILIADIIMPKADGIELITAVKKSYPEVRILAMSGRGRLGSLDLLDLAVRLGANAALEKPFTSEELLEALAGLRQCAPDDGEGSRAIGAGGR